MEAEGIDAGLAQVVAREFDSSGPAALVGIRRAQRDARAIFARTQLPDDARDALKKGINSQLWEKAAQAFVLSAHRAHFSGRRDPLHVIALALDIPSKLAAELITNANETLMRDFNLVRDVAPGVYFALLERPKDQERELHSRGPGGSGE
jgi:hypothetical protein